MFSIQLQRTAWASCNLQWTRAVDVAQWTPRRGRRAVDVAQWTPLSGGHVLFPVILTGTSCSREVIPCVTSGTGVCVSAGSTSTIGAT